MPESRSDTLNLGMLLLASASPHRRELLTQAGLTFTVDSADINENRLHLKCLLFVPGLKPYCVGMRYTVTE